MSRYSLRHKKPKRNFKTNDNSAVVRSWFALAFRAFLGIYMYVLYTNDDDDDDGDDDDGRGRPSWALEFGVRGAVDLNISSLVVFFAVVVVANMCRLSCEAPTSYSNIPLPRTYFFFFCLSEGRLVVRLVVSC